MALDSGYTLLILSIAMASQDITPVIVILTAIFWSKADRGLTIAEAFTSLSIASIAATPLVNILISVMGVFGALGCFARLQAFLILDDREDMRQMAPTSASRSSVVMPAGNASVSLTLTSDIKLDTFLRGDQATGATLIIEDAIFIVGENIEVLIDVNMTFPRDTISMIVGRVGCGKSTLLKAIAGELVMTKGRIVSNVSSIAYCDRNPWLQNASIRDNIVAQSPLDENGYIPCLRLAHWIKIFPCSPFETRLSLGPAV